MDGVQEQFRGGRTQDEIDSLESHLLMLRKAIDAGDPKAELLIRVDDALSEIRAASRAES